MFNVIEGHRVPIKIWNRGVPVEEEAIAQLRNLSTMPFVHKHLAAMADCHWGMGATVGSVIATKGAIIPAAVGVDIGCGMIAVKTGLVASDLPDSLSEMRSAIEAAVPHGRTDNGGRNDRGAWGDVPLFVNMMYHGPHPGMENKGTLADRYKQLTEKHPKAQAYNNVAHLGTLGTGNHFIEVCLDKEQNVWVMLHSGSRGAGNRIGQYFIQAAKKDMERWFINLPDKDLAYIPEGSELFKDYRFAVQWAQEFAMLNRSIMMEQTLGAISRTLGRKLEVTEQAVNCHHNYVSYENHFGENVIVTRKGAVSAKEGQLGIIPGSMGARSYIVRGKGNPESFCSCSHGAGRKMSRTKAKQMFSLEDHARATEGIECRKDVDVLDETPGAYKDIDAVMAAQADLVEVVAELRQVLCVKG